VLFKVGGLADLLRFGGVGAPGLLCCLPAYDRTKMRPVYSLFVGLTDISAFFGRSKRCSFLYVDSKKFN
jgi:hypothetical protein